jgi:small membrane protein
MHTHLNIFQIIVVPIVAALLMNSVYSLRRGTRLSRILGAAVWLAALVTVLRPETTMSLAKVLGIGRGADLILYVFVVSSLATAFYFYNRVVKLESALTVIVRHLAIKDPMHSDAVEKHDSAALSKPSLIISESILEL